MCVCLTPQDTSAGRSLRSPAAFELPQMFNLNPRGCADSAPRYRLHPRNLSRSERGVAAAGGKGAAPARGLLLAADRCLAQVLERVAGGFVPFLRYRAAARPP